MFTRAASLITVFLALSAHAWQPVGSLEELHDPALFSRLRPGVKAAMFSSYDRTGGNNDGFNGTYSKIREEDGNSVLAEMDGPGAIQRIWFTHSEHRQDGLLERKGEHIRIYIDGNERPALDVPLQALFDGSLERFPHPLAGSGIGGFFCYVPIPYTKSCKVVVEGLGVRFYQINYSNFPSAEGVRPFSMELTEDERAQLRRAVARWKEPLSVLEGTDVKVVEADPAGEGPLTLALPDDAGPALVLGVTLEGEPGEGEIEVGQQPDAGSAIRMPLLMYFCAATGNAPDDALFAGRSAARYYNLLPFYAAGAASVTVHPGKGTTGTFRLHYKPVTSIPEDAARLAAQVNESLPTVPDVYHPFLEATGQGHYVGTYLVTQGPKGMPYWLEGDDRWTLDGDLTIHGTGSEDYFNCGWYAVENRLDGPGGFPSHGFPVYGIEGEHMRANAYRWHLTDPVPFHASISAVIEHGEANKHIADYRSVAWYYTK